jgi:hypothetical protein
MRDGEGVLVPGEAWNQEKTPASTWETGAGVQVAGTYFEEEVKLAWLAPFLILLCLIQLMVERSFSPTFSIG